MNLEIRKKLLTSILITVLTVIGIGSDSRAETTEEEITITKTVLIKENEKTSGTVQIDDKSLNFEGTIGKTTEIIINWNVVDGKSLKPAFISKFQTQTKFLRVGQKVLIVGDFSKLLKKLEEIEGKEETESGEDAIESVIENVATSAAEAINNRDEGTDNKSTKTGATDKSGNEESQSDTNSEKEENKEETTIRFETCDSEIDGNIYKNLHRKITIYADGEETEDECVVKESFNIVEAIDDCGLRHDYESEVSYQQKKKIYYDSKGVVNELSDCVDTSETFQHLKMVANCEDFFDKGTSRSYKQKRSYIVNRAGEIVFVSNCRIDAGSIRSFTEEDYLREYSKNDYVDRENGYAYKRYRNYVEIADKEVFVSDYINDMSSRMPIEKDYEQCSYYHDINGKRSYKQFAEVYYRDGQKKVISDCRRDINISYQHLSDDRFCTPKLNQHKLYRTVKTYFVDQAGDIVSLSDCNMTDYELMIDNSEVGKNFEVCDPRIDLVGGVVYGWYREEITVGEKKEFISNCKEDASKQYTIQTTDEGCNNYVDAENSVAYQRKRKYYDTGLKKIFLTDCKKTENAFNFVTSPQGCKKQISADGKNYVEYEETYYLDITGDKKIVTTCRPSGKIDPIPIADKQRDYKKCGVKIDNYEGKAYLSYQEYILLEGIKTYLSECIMDISQFHAIYQTDEGCSNRLDIAGNKAIKQHRSYYNDGLENIFITECMDSNVSYAFQKSSNDCKEEISEDNKDILKKEETFYINGNGQKIQVIDCTLNGEKRPVAGEAIIKKFENCEDYPNYDEEIVYSQFASFIELNGVEVQIKECLIDFQAPTYSIEYDYEGCEDKLDFINMEATVTAQKYYRKDNQDVYLSECVETDLVYPIKEDTTRCQKIPIPDSNPPTYINQKKLYYYNNAFEVVEVKNCFPTASKGTATERVCTPEFVHDYQANQSYYNTRWAYDDLGGTEVVLKPCGFSTTKPIFRHHHATCGWYHDDSRMVSRIKTTRYFIDDRGRRIDVAGCEPAGLENQYTNVGGSDTGWVAASSTGDPGGCNITRYYVYDTNGSVHRDWNASMTKTVYGSWRRSDGSIYNLPNTKYCIWRETAHCYPSTGNRLDITLPYEWRRVKNCTGGIDCNQQYRCGEVTSFDASY